MRLRFRNQFRRARDERGFTLPEVLTTIAILGILIAIAMSLWNSVIESRRVDSAANQLASDMRLAHTKATNQLTDWRVVVILGREDEKKPDGSRNPDYYLMKLKSPYPNSEGSPPEEDEPERVARTLPGDVKVRQPGYQDSQGDNYFLSPESSVPPSTLTFEFNPDGRANVFAGVDGSACVTVDNDPELRVFVRAATSNVEIQDEDC